jgi:hypothetical protein
MELASLVYPNLKKSLDFHSVPSDAGTIALE